MTETPPVDAEVNSAGLAEQVRLLAEGVVSSTELTKIALTRADASQSTLNAFRWIRREQALLDAAEADRRLASGESGPLLGVPIAIKDDVDIAGLPTAFGCRGEFTPKAADCEAVRRLRAAGAVIIGKTNTPEIGQWPFTEGAAFGMTRNPWHLDHTPGGSSGGSAAAVAAGVVAAALGSDGAGSVRIPAAWTNLVGIKPQRDRISPAPEPELFHGLTVLGPLARTVTDAALLLDVAADAGSKYRDAASRPPGPLRIGLSTRIPFTATRTKLDPEVRAAIERLAETLRGLGHEVVPAEPAYGLIGLSFLPRSLTGVRDWCRRVPDRRQLDPRTRSNGKQGSVLAGPALRAARAVEPLLRKRVGAVFGQVDVVLAPTTAMTPPRIGSFEGLSGWETDQAMIAACPYAWPWNVLGWPGVNVPAGLTASGLPLGAQLLGPSDSEELLISLAAHLESAERWYDRRPATTW
ncbi:amidase [Amycolatopsis sp. CA-230715]|uniref:amidase n=1 Tax=Amycolatopsis sp. CA-230715 TaxID=2745196 RepID=UPI001C01C63E|nr:amidase [Amycolatopsis sp. CA-230715]QWF79959.1 Putative amidase AmiA2 [Amycolatopsis sp. CA-230715]